MIISIESVARICHEANKAYCEALGDMSQVHWNEAEDWQKQSAINGVKFRLEHPDSSPGAMHENWVQEKVEAGWKYGPVKSPETKRHPCLVDWCDLPRTQRKKDSIFATIVDSLRDIVKV